MAHRSIGQERLGFEASVGINATLDGLCGLINWDEIAGIDGQVHANVKDKAAWPPLAMFKALLLSVWYDLSDVNLAEALFRTFCGTELTPERTAFVRFCKALIAHDLDRRLFTTVTAQLKSKARSRPARLSTPRSLHRPVRTMMRHAGSSTWIKHKGKRAVHGYKAHVGADADTALVEEIAITSANVNDGRAGPDALPDNPGEVFADSAYRGNHFRDAVRAKGGSPRIIATGMWGRDEAATVAKLKAWNQPIHRVRGRIEKIFGTWKRSYGLRRMRWRGIVKAAVQIHLTAIAYNLKRMLNITGMAK